MGGLIITLIALSDCRMWSRLGSSRSWSLPLPPGLPGTQGQPFQSVDTQEAVTYTRLRGTRLHSSSEDFPWRRQHTPQLRAEQHRSRVNGVGERCAFRAIGRAHGTLLRGENPLGCSQSSKAVGDLCRSLHRIVLPCFVATERENMQVRCRHSTHFSPWCRSRTLRLESRAMQVPNLSAPVRPSAIRQHRCCREGLHSIEKTGHSRLGSSQLATSTTQVSTSSRPATRPLLQTGTGGPDRLSSSGSNSRCRVPFFSSC